MSTITKEFTKEQLQQIEAAAKEVLWPVVWSEKKAREHFSEKITPKVVLKLARIALASLEAGPVAWLLSGGGAKNNVSFDSGNAYADPLREVTPLYTAPPAPVSVPDESAIFDAAIDICRKSDAIDEHAWNHGVLAVMSAFSDCRASMLNHSEVDRDMVQRVSQPYKLSFDQWMSQQEGSIDVECGCVMTEVLFHWMRVAYEAGNYPVIPSDSEDTKRLDWLDAQNKRLNEYYGTLYGWKFDANFQRNAMMLNDSNYPVMTVRQAIDQAIAAAPQQEGM